MLDSVNTAKMLPTVAATVALATAKLSVANDDATQIAICATVKTQTQITTTTATPTKTKTILNWFRGTKSVDSGEPIYANHTNQAKRANGDAKAQTQRAKSLPSTQDTPTTPSADTNLREFRGVQSLRHLWNKRISASEDATRRSKSLIASKANKLNKSIGCLVPTSNHDNETATHEPTAATVAVNKRAQSLHDCTQVGVTIAETATIETELDCVHREKDNFYKYKTAEQATRHLAREARVRAKTRRLTAGIVSSDATQEDAHFPATRASEKGERIHWLKRQDIVLRSNKQHDEQQQQQELEQDMAIKQLTRDVSTCAGVNSDALQTASSSAISSPLSATDIVISDHTELKTNKQRAQLPTTTTKATATMLPTVSNSCSAVGTDTDTNTATLRANNSPGHSVSRKRTAQRDTTISNSSSVRGSTDSSNASTATLSTERTTTQTPTTSGGRVTRRTNSSSSSSNASQTSAANPTARKYSFKTHTRSYHVPRKMSNRDSTNAGNIMGVSGGGNGVSVAKLTQQFNEMIQKDKKLLEEVKRKNGVLMARGGHIYKVVEKTSIAEATGGKKSIVANNAPSITRNSARASMVQRNIRKFENGVGATQNTDTVEQLEKPAVPAKSAQVLRKLREHNKTQHLSLNGAPPTMHKRLHLSLPAATPVSASNAELHAKLELKKAQLTLPLAAMPLEVVTEESKTPLEAYEQQSIAPVISNNVNSNQNTAAVSDIRAYVPNGEMAESTYSQLTTTVIATTTITTLNDAEIFQVESATMQSSQSPASSVDGIGKAVAVIAYCTEQRKNDIELVGNATNINVNEPTKSAELQMQINSGTDEVNNKNKTNASNNNNNRYNNDNNAQCIYATIELEANAAVNVRTAASRIPTTANVLEMETAASAETATLTAAPANSEAEAVRLALAAAADASNTVTTLTTATITTTTTADDLDDIGEEKAKQRKHKYAKIYEKFRFRSPFGGGQSKKQSPSKTTTLAAPTEITTNANTKEMVITAQTITTATTMSEVTLATSTSTTTTTKSATASTPTATVTPPALTPPLMASTALPSEPEPAAAKILDALHMVDEKLKGLTIDNDTAGIMLCAHDDFEQRILPNNSFVYQASAKQVANNQLIVAQAVNVTLVNSFEGEQMVLEQKDLHQQQQQRALPTIIYELQDTSKIPIAEESTQSAVASTEEEPMYEPIAEQSTVTKTDYQVEPEQIIPTTPRSFIFKSCTASKVYAEAEVTKAAAIELPESTATTQSPQMPPAPTLTCALLEDIYQTVEEANSSTSSASACANTNNNQLPDYESIAGSCEQTITMASIATPKPLYDGYEICEPPPDAPNSLPLPLPPPTTLPALPTATFSTATLNSSPQSTTLTNVRNTNDELPELPKPKRRLPKSPMPGKRADVNKPTATHETSSGDECSHTPTPKCTTLDDNDDHHYYADDENIYDTIKGSHCYESLHAETVKAQKATVNAVGSNKNNVVPASGDNISLSSNCYESISHYRRVMHPNGGHMAGSSSGSTLTISSDHKTNSLYEMCMTTSALYGTEGGSLSGYRQLDLQLSKRASICGMSAYSSNNSGGGLSDGGSGDAKARNNNYCHSNGATVGAGSNGGNAAVGGCSSDNSDEWVDISDAEAEQQFIVVRERCNKVHRSPDWSRRVRDKRLHQKKAISCIEDDSDHYYETLSPLSNKRHSTQLVQRSNSHHKRNQDLPRSVMRVSQRSRGYYAHALGNSPISDDYDSFDTDTDELYEAEENMKNHNDSGVDIRNVKLPDPPPSTNQVYAIVRKLKNFISNKKSPSKYGGSQQKLYENSAQFYVSGNIYENSPKIKAKPNKYNTAGSKKSIAATQDDNIYENTEFHTPPKMSADDKQPHQLSTSEKNLCTTAASKTADAPPSESATTLRVKSKTGKSFKSRLRKSLAGASFDTKQLSALTPTRSTFYIEDPSYGGSGELDSGFSEKASSGDLPTAPAVPLPETQKFLTVARKTKKESKQTNAQRRRTTIGIRPMEPPPPPPPVVANSMTSWYTECGVFKQGTNNAELQEDMNSVLNGSSKSSQHGSSLSNITSWYTEAGLYQTSGVSVASSSGSSGVSTGNEGTPGDDMPHSFFQNEPLYQIYSAAKLESITRDMEDQDSSTDGYEEVGQNGPLETRNLYVQKRHLRPSAYQLIEPKNGPARTLWSEIPEVVNSYILPTLTPRERSLQEAKFEIITSEASYLKSLNLLRNHFMNHPIFRDTHVVSARDRKALFAYILPVHECSERLLTELETCWQDNIMLLGLSRRIYAIAEKHFHVYIAFCEHQGRMDRALRRLKEGKGVFAQNLDLLETSPICCGLNLHSFLMLPMQRITRLPLLIDAVFSKVSPNDDEYDSWKMTLAIMNKIVTQCNEAANRCEQAYEIERIARQLEFPSTLRALAVAPVGVPVPGARPRFLVKKGELTHLIWRGDDVKLTFGKKFTKSSIYAFLFSDLLVLTKRKTEEQFTVFDYCPRSMLTMTSGDLRDISQTHRNLILMTLLENHERKTVELVLSCPSVSEQERWLQAVRPLEPETPGEKLYEAWDCPQVIAKHVYETKEPDALPLEVGDVVNVTRKLPDGWYQGERLRDGASGWFPGSYTEEVNSAHVRARNLKQRQRLLTFTATYLESQKRK